MTGLMQGFTASGVKIHAVEPLPDAPTTGGHHGRRRRALCGVLCAVKPWSWAAIQDRPAKACARCRTISVGTTRDRTPVLDLTYPKPKYPRRRAR